MGIRMGEVGDLVIVLENVRRRAVGPRGGPYTAEWEISRSPLGKIVGYTRQWDNSSAGMRTTSYKVSPVDSSAGYGEFFFRPSSLRRPTRKEIRKAIEAGLVQPDDNQPQVSFAKRSNHPHSLG